MSNLYIDTVQVVGGVLTPVIAVLLIVAIIRSLEALAAKTKERTEKLKYEPGFEVRLHKVPNPNMWGVEISKDGEVLEDVGVDKL
jgi:hypothetical protein